MLMIHRVRRIKKLREKLAKEGAGDDERKVWHDEMQNLLASLPPSIPNQLKRLEHSLELALNNARNLEASLPAKDDNGLDLVRDNSIRHSLTYLMQELEEAMCILKGGDS